MLQIRRVWWQAVTLALLSLYAHPQTVHYSVLCNLLRESQNHTDSDTIINFEVKVPHRVISNIKAFVAQGPRRIVILRDTSESIAGKNAQALSLEVVKDLAETSQASDQLSLIDFSDKSQTTIDLQDRNAFSKQFNDLKLTTLPKPKGHTAIFDAIEAAVIDLQKSPRDGDSILVITDGEDNTSKIRPEKLKRHLLTAEIRVYWLALADPYLRTQEQEVSQSEMTHLLADTGGQVMAVAPVSQGDMSHGPDYDASPRSLAFLHKQVEFLYGAMTKPVRIQFDTDAPLTGATKLTVSPFGKDGKPTLAFRTVCPKYINQD
jgi:hypothetical protein